LFPIAHAQKYLHWPVKKTDIEKHLDTFRLLGLPGVIALTDCTIIPWSGCHYKQTLLHEKGKKSKPSLNVISFCSFDREIFHIGITRPGLALSPLDSHTIHTRCRFVE